MSAAKILEHANLPPELQEILEKAMGLTQAQEELAFEGFGLFDGGRLAIEDLPQLFGETRRKAAHLLETKGEVLPVAFVFGTRGLDGNPLHEGEAAHFMLGARIPFDDETKDLYSEAIRKLAWKTHAVATVFITEAWSSMQALRLGVLATDAPDREEAVQILQEEVGSIVMWRAVIHRDGDGKPTAGEWESRPHGPGCELGGRFTQLLLSNAVGQPSFASLLRAVGR